MYHGKSPMTIPIYSITKVCFKIIGVQLRDPRLLWKISAVRRGKGIICQPTMFFILDNSEENKPQLKFVYSFCSQTAECSVAFIIFFKLFFS